MELLEIESEIKPFKSRGRHSQAQQSPSLSTVIGREIGAIHKNWQHHRRIALVYPNTYPVGMTNLGYQRLYQIFNEDDDYLCERVFLSPEALAGGNDEPRSCESGRRLREFDVIAFSISFETDYLNVLRVLQLSGIPLRTVERQNETFPIILGGGCGITVNPEPLADFMDVICIGEGEDFVSGFKRVVLERLENNLPMQTFLEACEGLPGMYVPSFFSFEYVGSRVAGIRHLKNGQEKILRLITKNLDPVPTQTTVIPVETPFRNMFMVETGRGCEWACRFCAAGYIYRYPRERGVEALKGAVDRGLELGMRIGLVGSDMSCHSYIGELMEYILDRGGEPSLSSIRVEAIDDRMAALIARTGIKTMTLAPDAGSFRLRRVLNKNMPDEMILAAAARLLDHGIRNIKLYFIIGLPTETEADIDELIKLAEGVRDLMKVRAPKLGTMGTVSISINPFVPKPGTPFQWVGLEPEEVIQARFAKIRQTLMPQGNFKLDLESYRGCYLQAFISRGDRRAGDILEHMLLTGKKIDRAAKDLYDRLGYVPSEQVNRTWDFSEILPWNIVDHGFTPGYLEKEMERGFATKPIPNCKPEVCKLCGVC